MCSITKSFTSDLHNHFQPFITKVILAEKKKRSKFESFFRKKEVFLILIFLKPILKKMPKKWLNLSLLNVDHIFAHSFPTVPSNLKNSGIYLPLFCHVKPLFVCLLLNHLLSLLFHFWDSLVTKLLNFALLFLQV